MTGKKCLKCETPCEEYKKTFAFSILDATWLAQQTLSEWITKLESCKEAEDDGK